MRTVAVLREAQKINRRKRREYIREQMRQGADLPSAETAAVLLYDAEYRVLERNIEFMKVPGQSRRGRG